MTDAVAPMIFDADSLARVVGQALANADVPADHRTAIVVAATSAGVRGVVSVRAGDAWTITGVVALTPDGHLDGGVAVKASW